MCAVGDYTVTTQDLFPLFCAKNQKRAIIADALSPPRSYSLSWVLTNKWGTDISAGPQTVLPAYSTAIGISFPLASSVFGSVTVNTPSLKVAFTLFASTVFGSANDRVKFPPQRSTR